jgi:hypothetical protein
LLVSIHKGSKLIKGLWLWLWHWWSVLFIQSIKIELALALRTEMIEILYDPLPYAFLVEYMLTGQHNGLLHVLIADSASQIVELLQLLPSHLLQLRHRGS